MKTLKDILLEKLDINNVNLASYGFPINGTIKDMIKFLKMHRFKQMPLEDAPIEDTIYYLNKEKNKCYIIYNGNVSKKTYNTIRFADTSKKNISEENPMFAIFITDFNEYTYAKECNCAWEQTTTDSKKFSNMINKHFKF